MKLLQSRKSLEAEFARLYELARDAGVFTPGDTPARQKDVESARKLARMYEFRSTLSSLVLRGAIRRTQYWYEVRFFDSRLTE